LLEKHLLADQNLPVNSALALSAAFRALYASFIASQHSAA